MNFIYSIEAYQDKPTGAAVGALQKPRAYKYADCSVPEMAQIIGSGHAWRAGLYDEDAPSFKKANVKAAQVLALDFDARPDAPEDVIEYAESIGLPPSLWYWSYSQGKKPGNNFRVLWVLEEPIKPIQYETIYKNLLDAFKKYEPDAATKDASRLWFGTRKAATIINEKPVPLAVIAWLSVCKKLEEGQTVQKAKKAVKGCENEYFQAQAAADVEPFPITQGETKWWERLRVRCWLWDKWERGEYLNYNQRLTLFTNLKYLRYTDNNHSVFRDVMDFYNPATYSGHTCDEAQILGMFLNTTLYPLGIVEAGEEKPLTVAEWFRRGNKEVINAGEGKIPLEELDALLDEHIPRLLSDEGIIYIKAQAACGKTHRVIDWMLSQDLTERKIIYAVPQYTNIKEFVERFEAAQERQGQQPGAHIHTIPKGKYTPHDLLLMEMGFPARTRQDERYKAIQEMINPANKGVYVATHQLIAHLRECPADCIIIDENIEDALVDGVVLDKAGIGGLIGFFKDRADRDTVQDFIEVMDGMERGEKIDVSPLRQAIQNSFEWNDYINGGKTMAGVGKLLDTSADARITKQRDVSGIRFLTRSTLITKALQNSIPIKLLSATPKPARLAAAYGTEEIPVYSFPEGRNEGEIIQYTGMTGAKGNNCEKIPELISYVVSKVPPEDLKRAKVISFLGAIPYWEDAGFEIPSYKGEKIHLANNAGLDFLKGQVVIVAGKFDNDDDTYLDLFYDLHPHTTQPPHKETWCGEINNRLVRLYLWNDADLRALQIENIQLYLSQSVGRARALREAGAKVYLFANFPILEADRSDE